MNLIRFTFANIFDFKSVMDSIKKDIHKDINLYEPSCFHSSNMNKLIITFTYITRTYPITSYVADICTPTAIEDLREHTNNSFTHSNR